VNFRQGGSAVPRAEVEARLHWIGAAARPATVEVGMAEDGFPGGYGAFVRDFGPAAEVLSVPGGRFRLPVGRRGDVHYSYSVVLEHAAGEWGPGPDEAPYRFDEGTVWTGRALFVTAARSRVEVAFAAPAGAHVFTSFEPASRAFRVADQERLRDSFVVVGRPAVATLKAGKAKVTLLLGGALKPSLPVVRDAIAHFLDASTRLFGGAPRRRVLVVGNVGGRAGSFDGGVYGDDVSLLVDGPLGAAFGQRWRPFLAHEIFHLWNGRSLVYEGQQYWMSEGFTDYYARLLLVRSGQLTGESFRADLERRASRYLDGRTGVGLWAAGQAKFQNPTLVYEGGALAALCLDVSIRTATANAKSLDDVMKALYAGFAGPASRPITLDDVRRVASSVAGVPFDEFFTRHVTGGEALPLAEALRAAGFDFQAAVRELPPASWAASGLLRCPSLTAVPGVGLKVLRSESDALRAGDVIAAVGGAPVDTIERLRMAMADLAPRDVVPVHVTRDGAPLMIEVTLGGDPAGRPVSTRVPVVSLTPLPDAPALARAIRASLFRWQERGE
jgi:predicted metalloprotease with PDZ domain